MSTSIHPYIHTSIHTFVSKFRLYDSTSIGISIELLAPFIQTDSQEVCYLLDELKRYNFYLTIKESSASETEHLNVSYYTSSNTGKFSFDLSNLGLLCTIASRIGVSVWLLVLMKVVAQVICRIKILYKAIVLDLDDTLWLGTLSEDGYDAIDTNMRASSGQPFIQFMRYVKMLSEEWGIFVAVCTRNDSEKVEEVLRTIDESVFPIKSSIDCVIANNNSKSSNIKAIAQALNIREEAVVFVDNSPKERAEVQKDLPHVFVPVWVTHQGLIDQIVATCVFDRHRVALHDRGRKKRYHLLQEAKERNKLPPYLLRFDLDVEHKIAEELYSRLNQFVLCSSGLSNVDKGQACSLVYYLSDSGEEFGRCSTLTYGSSQDVMFVFNWGISCGFFEIGLEEKILLHIITIAQGKTVVMRFEDTARNIYCKAMLDKYGEAFRLDEANDCLIFEPTEDIILKLEANTNLKI